MALKTIIVTGSAGLVGSECVRYFAGKGYRVVGIDNDERLSLFGVSTADNLLRLFAEVPEYIHYAEDITKPGYVRRVFEPFGYDAVAVIHCAAQPSHDYSAVNPQADFEINEFGTFHLLEASRKYCPQAAFVFMSTNKVYGDAPNSIAMDETPTRYEAHHYPDGINQSLSVDHCTHSPFGASKLAADIRVQEWGRYFGMNTVCFRGGCLTGPAHAGTKLHGFLSYLVKCCVTGEPYEVIGYGGKQVRDNIHSADLVTAFDLFIQNPKQGAVYNIGGGRENSCSVLEAIALAEEVTGKKMQVTFKDDPRIGDHKWWISDCGKFKADYPEWNITKSLRDIVTEIAAAFERKAAA